MWMILDKMERITKGYCRKFYSYGIKMKEPEPVRKNLIWVCHEKYLLFGWDREAN